MLVVATSAVADVIALVIAVGGLGGLVFTALRYRRDDTSAIVQTQSTIVHDMQALTGELRTALEDCERRGGRAR